MPCDGVAPRAMTEAVPVAKASEIADVHVAAEAAVDGLDVGVDGCDSLFTDGRVMQGQCKPRPVMLDSEDEELLPHVQGGPSDPKFQPHQSQGEHARIDSIVPGGAVPSRFWVGWETVDELGGGADIVEAFGRNHGGAGDFRTGEYDDVAVVDAQMQNAASGVSEAHDPRLAEESAEDDVNEACEEFQDVARHLEDQSTFDTCVSFKCLTRAGLACHDQQSMCVAHVLLIAGVRACVHVRCVVVCLAMMLFNVSILFRIMGGFFEAATTGGDRLRHSRTQNVIERAFGSPTTEWQDANGAWVGMLVGRIASQRVKLARLFLLFLRAIVIVVVSHRQHPTVKPYSELMIAEWVQAKAASTDGCVPVGAVIKSLRYCGSRSFAHALHMLHWAGHMKCYGTLTAFRFAFKLVVSVWFETEHLGDGQDDGAVVRSNSNSWVNQCGGVWCLFAYDVALGCTGP